MNNNNKKFKNKLYSKTRFYDIDYLFFSSNLFYFIGTNYSTIYFLDYFLASLYPNPPIKTNSTIIVYL